MIKMNFVQKGIIKLSYNCYFKEVLKPCKFPKNSVIFLDIRNLIPPPIHQCKNRDATNFVSVLPASCCEAFVTTYTIVNQDTTKSFALKLFISFDKKIFCQLFYLIEIHIHTAARVLNFSEQIPVQNPANSCVFHFSPPIQNILQVVSPELVAHR